MMSRDILKRPNDFYEKAKKRLERGMVNLITNQEKYVFGCKSYKKYEKGPWVLFVHFSMFSH